MPGKLTYRIKNRILLAGIPAALIICYLLAFSKTYETVKLHSQLSRQADGAANLSFNPGHTADKLRRVNSILDQYKADTTAWRDDFWMLASGMAARKGISVIYDQKKETGRAGRVSSGIAGMEIQFIGNYRGLVQLIDSLERDNRIGFLSGLEMKRTKEGFDSKPGKIMVKANFKVVSK